jgi:D-alanyl-D-alanine carboxypeptidase (penicillin-binding protein 5/6)
VLFANNDHTPLPPGSLSKILTALIAVGWLPADAVVPVTAQAAAVSPERIGMEPGQQWTLSEALQSALIFSANDASYALAQRISGSLAAFATVMTDAAGQIGLVDHPVLRDPAGLDGTEGFEGGNLISAWDVATMARDLMADPALADIVRLPQLDFKGPNGTVYGLHNQNLYFLHTYPGAIGVKTGLTDRAGFCVAEEAVRGARHMLAVVLNGTNSYQSAASLLDTGFTTPVAAEPNNGPTLPPVAAPAPSPPPVPTTLRPRYQQDPVGVAANYPAPQVARRSDDPNRYKVDAGAAAAVGVVAVLVVIWTLRDISWRRRSGLHWRRR